MPVFGTYWSGLDDGALSDAGKVGITDTSGVYTSTNVDGALDEIGDGTANIPYEPLQLIATVTTSTTETVTFSSIPSTFRDLVFTIDEAPAGSGNLVACRFNGDTGSNYEGHRWRAVDATTSSQLYTPQVSAFVGPHAASTDVVCHVIGTIPNYAGSNIKLVVSEGYNTNQTYYEQSRFMFTWNNTDAITSIVFGVSSAIGNFAAGTTINLYGRG